MRKRRAYEPFTMDKRRKGITDKTKVKDLPYYIQYRNLEGKRITAISSGITTKIAAITWANANRDRILAKHYEQKGDPLKQLLTDFYLPNSTYLQSLKNRGVDKGAEHIKHCASYMRNYFIPFFEENSIHSFHDIDRPALIELQNYIKESGEEGKSAKTVNNAMSSLKQIFDYQIDNGKITGVNPFNGIKWMSDNGEKMVRGAFPLEQVKKIWDKQWDDQLLYMLTMIGATCGMRNSEIGRLKVSSIIQKKDQFFLNVEKSKTKAGIRTIPLHTKTHEKIVEYIAILGLSPDDYLFRQFGKEIYYKTFGYAVKYAGGLMGFDDQYLDNNNISFYSWRHFFNSLLISSNVNIYKTKMVMGHSLNGKNDMSGNYYKQIDDDYSDVLGAVNKLFV